MKQKQQQPQVDPRNEKDSGLRFRSAEVDTVEEDGKPVMVRMSVSSETPVLSHIRMGDQWITAWEILDHNESSIDRSRCADGLVIQDTHYGDQVGLIRAPVIVGKKWGGIVEFCAGERAKDIASDAANGLRKNSSVGYMADPQKYVIEGEKDGYPVVRCLRWTPYEASFVNVPADVTVGVGRSIENTIAAATTPQEREQEMNPKEMAELFARAAKYGIEAAKVSELIEGGKGRAELDALIVEKQERELITAKQTPAKPELPAVRELPKIGGDQKTEDKIVRQFSVLNVMRRAAGITTFGFGQKVDCGFEDEINQECRNLGLGSIRGGQFVIPHAVLANRTLSVSGTSSATVATNLLGGEFIDLVRSASIMGPLGIRMMPGLVGNIDIPKMTAGATGYWVSEGSAVTGSQPTAGQVEGTPHTCGVMVDITRRMLLQSTPSAEQFTRDEILARIARTIQIAVFAGTGADGQPSAITTATDINNPSVTQGTPTYAEILSFIGDIFSDNAAGGSMKWAMTGEVWAKLAATTKDSGSGQFVLNPDVNRMLGYEWVQPCSDLPANSLWFGDWSTVNVGVWGAGVDLNLDTATLSSSGGLRIVGLQDVDVMVRLGQKLAYNTAVTA